MKVDSEAVKVGRFDEFYSLIVLITEYNIPNVDNYLVMNPFFLEKRRDVYPLLCYYASFNV